jgi:hypothetical protein
MFRRSQPEKIIESLQTHLDFLDAAAKRHNFWVQDVSDPATETLYLEILGLIRQTREKYRTLIGRYNGDIE